MTAVSPTTTSQSQSSASSLGSLSANYNQFLTLLTTQLKNQDPSNPLDASQFTSELAQFAGVEQQISTNTNLTSLIQLTQSQQVLQGAAVLGRQAALNSTTLPLQNGSAHLTFTSPASEPVTISVANSSGSIVYQQTLQAASGSNGWSWDGRNAAGVQLADGAYTAAVSGTDAGGSTSDLAFSTLGTVTGVSQSGGAVSLQFGTASVPITSLAQLVT